MAFDAGSIEATLELDRDPFQQGLQAARAEAEAFEQNTITAQVDVDSTAATAGLAATRTEAEALDGMRVNINVDADVANALTQFAQVRAAAGGLGRDVDVVSRSADSAGGSLGGMQMRTVVLAAAISTLLAPALGILSTLIASIGPAAVIAGGAFASIKLGMDGIKEAAKVLDPQIAAIKKTLTQQWKDGLTPMFKSMRDLFPGIQRGLGAVTSGLLAMAKGALDAVKEASKIEGIEMVLRNVGNFFTSLRPMVGDFTNAFITLARVGTERLGSLSVALQGFAKGFNDVIQQAASSGVLQSAFEGLAQVVGSLGGLFNQFMASGLQMMSQLGGPISQFISSFAGMFSTLAPILTQISQLLMGVFTEAFRALQPVFAAVTPAITQFATQLGGVLATGIQTVVPILTPLINGIMQLASAITPLIPPIIQVAAALAQGLLAAVTPLIPVVVQLGQILGGALTQAAQTLSPILVQVGTIIGQNLQPVARAIVPVIQLVASMFNSVLQAVAPLLPPLMSMAQTIIPPLMAVIEILAGLLNATLAPALDWVTGFVGPLAKKFTDLIAPVKAVGDWFGSLGEKLGLTKKSAETNVPPIGTTVEKSMDTATEAAKTGGTGIQTGVQQGTQGAAAAAKTNMPAIPQATQQSMSQVPKIVGDNMKQVPEQITANMTQAKTTMQTTTQEIVAAMKAAWDQMKTDTTTFFTEWQKIFTDGFTVILKMFQEAVLAWLATLDPAIFEQAGAALMDGLIAGIASRMAALQAQMTAVANTIRGAIPASPAKWGPLSGRGAPNYAGEATINMLAEGLSRTTPIERQMAQLASLMSPSAGARVSALASVGQRNVNTMQPQAATPRAGIENLNVFATRGLSAQAVIEEALFAIQHAGRGVYSGR